MKDYSRKNYSDKQYKDWMRTTTSKSIFNRILENSTGLGEFSNNKSNKTSLSRAVAAFLKQSEFKKPYNGLDFKEMEEDWEGPPGLSNHGFDQPWNMQIPWIPVSSPPLTAIFDAESDSVWCKSSYLPIIITGTNPITLLTITFAASGAALSNIVGYGTNTVTATLKVGSSQTGFVTIEASMLAANGLIGSSNVNLFEGDDCCTNALSPTGGFAFRSSLCAGLRRSLSTAPADATWAAARDTASSKTVSVNRSFAINYAIGPPEEYGCGRIGVGLYLDPGGYPANFSELEQGISITTNAGCSPSGKTGTISLWTISRGTAYSAWTTGDYGGSIELASDFHAAIQYDIFGSGKAVRWKLNDAGMEAAYAAIAGSRMLYLIIRDDNYDVPNIAPGVGGISVYIAPSGVGATIGSIPYCLEKYPFFEGSPT